jgi:hypothetical protein
MTKIQPDPPQRRTLPRGLRTIRFPICEADYERFLEDRSFARSVLDALLQAHPECFPEPMPLHYTFYGFTRLSRKSHLRCRRLQVGPPQHAPARSVFTLMPSFMMPYMSGRTAEVDRGLLLLRYHVPYWVVAGVCGRSAMYWYRLQCALGRMSLVGTTVRDPKTLPRHLVADEKHTWRRGRKCYLALTAAAGCILGASLSRAACEQGLSQAYGRFAEEATALDPSYEPETVNTDGWLPTQQAWQALFPLITVIQCFLHAFLKVRERATKRLAEAFAQVRERIWQGYRAATRRAFSQRLRRLREWAEGHLEESPMRQHVVELCAKRERFARSYGHVGAHRTSNLVDRLMRVMDRALFMTQYFHGKQESAELRVRAVALLWNFCPSSPETVRRQAGKRCPAERLNGFRYCDSWLENLLVSASMNGYRQHNPV